MRPTSYRNVFRCGWRRLWTGLSALGAETARGLVGEVGRGSPRKRSLNSVALLMCPKVLTSLVLIGTILVCGVGLESTNQSAEARDYYTRKRVNGVWTTGHFRRKPSVRTVTKQSQAVTPAHRSAGASTPTGLVADQNREDRNAANALSFDPPPPETGLVPLRRALEERAKIMATAATSVVVPPRTIKSMTLDFESRVRVIQFADGSRSEEPLDPSETGALSATALPLR